MPFKWLAFLAFALLISATGAADASKVVITINKVSQKMTVEIDGDVEYRWPVSTGARGYDTPSGKYRPFRMEKDHFSREWDDAPMPHSIFFTGKGHAIHGSYHVKSLGRRASHGCVRLHPDNAEKLYALVKEHGMKNTTVVVKGGFFEASFEDLEEETAEIGSEIRSTYRKNSKKFKKDPFWWLKQPN